MLFVGSILGQEFEGENTELEGAEGLDIASEELEAPQSLFSGCDLR